MHRGKRGATRVGFAYFRSRDAIIVLAIFAKNEAANFTAVARAEIAKWLKQFDKDFR
jgi:hypothetical protein